MGAFEVTVGVGRIGEGELTLVTALVNTGSPHSVMPESLLKRLGLSPMEYLPFTGGGSREMEYGYGMARLSIDGREFPCPVIFGPDGQCWLGRTGLQIFNLIVDPTEEKLVTKPLRARAI